MSPLSGTPVSENAWKTYTHTQRHRDTATSKEEKQCAGAKQVSEKVEKTHTHRVKETKLCVKRRRNAMWQTSEREREEAEKTHTQTSHERQLCARRQSYAL
jgi:hypothetical protein